MEDYLHYMLFSSISVGDVAYEIGDYITARQHYNKALNQLLQYQGDSMVAINVGASLRNKLASIPPSNQSGNDRLFFEKWQLSKSSYIKGNQCVKYLYLDKYNKKDATKPTPEQIALFKLGHDFEDKFRKQKFPDGINIKEKVGNFAYFNSYTKHLLKSERVTTLYEATIIEDRVMVMVDVLVKNSKGLFDFYEVKLNSELNDVIFNDLCLQYYVCKKRFGDSINSFNVVLRDPKNENNFIVKDLKEKLDESSTNISDMVNQFSRILSDKMPVVSVGSHCETPYACPFKQFCSENKG